MMRGRITGTTRLTGILGWPVAHSLSPQMHNAVFEQLGLDFVYVPWPVPHEALAGALAGLHAVGAVGANVTIPHKVSVAALCDALMPEAELAGAVNTLVWAKDGRLSGHNTDGAGFLAALSAQQPFEARGTRVVLLGAGGAARAIAAALATAGALSIDVVNRSAPRAAELCAYFGERLPRTRFRPRPLQSGSLRTALKAADLLVNATSIGLHGETLDALPLDAMRPTTLVVDAVYRREGETPLCAAARARGLRTSDGLGMLVHQAALAQRIWTGIDPPIDVMMQAVRAG
jgi:shikimate dehydrogenase